MAQCAKILDDNFPCQAPPMHDSIYCVSHSDDPALVRRLQEARSRGGKAAHAPPKPLGLDFDISSPEAILTTIQAVGQALSEGRCDRSVANSLSMLCRNAVEAHRIVGFGRRLRRLEEEAAAREGRTLPPEGET